MESRIAAEFGVSRAPVRRALAELERLGLLTACSGRGFRLVRGMDAQQPGRAPPSEPAQVTTLATWQRIYGEVETQIMSRAAFASWRVNEAKLAEHHGVSRTVARDVLARMQQYNIIQKDSKSRWYAPELTPAFVDDLYEIRWSLEPLALRKAGPAIRREQIEDALAALAEAEARRAEITGDDVDRLESDMHIRLLEPCENKSLLRVIRITQSLLITDKLIYNWQPSQLDTETFVMEHAEILREILAGRIDNGVELLERHLRLSVGRCQSKLAALRRGAAPPAPLPYIEMLA